MSDKPSVLFVCVHNAGRSQMAAAWLEHLAGDRVDVYSAGSEPAEHVNPVAVDAMREVGLDIADEQPKILTDESVQRADVVITMGCGDTCPFFPGKRYLDWELTDPAGQPIEVVRRVRDEIKARVQSLVDELLPAGTDVRLAAVDEPRLEQLVATALDDATAAEVTPPLTLGDDWTPQRVDWLREFHRERRAGLDGPLGEATWAVLEGGTVVGSVRLKRTGRPDAVETGIWLARSARGRGIGRSALAAVLELAKAAGMRDVRAETTAGNVAAIGILRGLGFQLSEADADGVIHAECSVPQDMPTPPADANG